MRIIYSINNKPGGSILVFLFVFVLLSIFAKSILVCRVCVAIMFLGCIVLGYREPRFANPYYLFSITPLSLSVYSDIGGIYMLPLSYETWVLAIINIYAFLWALFITPRFKAIRNCIGISSKRGLIFGALIMYLIAIVSRLVPSLNPLFWFTSFAAMVFALKSKSLFGYIFCAVLFLVELLSGSSSKMGMLLYVLTFLICFDKFFTSTKIQRRMLVLLSALGMAFMVFAFSFANKERGKSDVNESRYYYEQQGDFDWAYSSSFLLPYFYLTTPWTNVEYVIHSQDTRTYGLWMIKPLLGYLRVDEKYEKEYKLEPYSTFNTFTFVCCGFKDFGFWLSILASLFLGFFVKKVYSRYVISRSPFDVLSYIIVALATAEMFFSNHFYMQSYPFTAVLMMELYKFLVYLGGNTTMDLEKNLILT